MVPSFANFGGKVHGGVILSLMDKVAYACASKHAGAYCVTVTVDGVEFLQPVEVGDLLHLDVVVERSNPVHGPPHSLQRFRRGAPKAAAGRLGGGREQLEELGRAVAIDGVSDVGERRGLKRVEPVYVMRVRFVRRPS